MKNDIDKINDLLEGAGIEPIETRPYIIVFAVMREGIADESDSLWGLFSSEKEAEKAIIASTWLGDDWYMDKDKLYLDMDKVVK